MPDTSQPRSTPSQRIDLPRLMITNAEGRQKAVPLDRGQTWRIGRGQACKVVLDDNAASRRHAIIQRTEFGDYYLVDAGSRNGTFIHGQRVTA